MVFGLKKKHVSGFFFEYMKKTGVDICTQRALYHGVFATFLLVISHSISLVAFILLLLCGLYLDLHTRTRVMKRSQS